MSYLDHQQMAWVFSSACGEGTARGSWMLSCQSGCQRPSILEGSWLGVMVWVCIPGLPYSYLGLLGIKTDFKAPCAKIEA